MKKQLKSLKGFEPISNEGLNSVRGGVTLNTVTITVKKELRAYLQAQPDLSHIGSDDGDDGIRND